MKRKRFSFRGWQKVLEVFLVPLLILSLMIIVVKSPAQVKVASPKVENVSSSASPLSIWVANAASLFSPISLNSYNPTTGSSTGNSIKLGTLYTMRSIGFSSDGRIAVATGDNSSGGIVIDIANLTTNSDVELSDPNYTDNTTIVTSDVVITPNNKWAYVGLDAPNEIDLYVINLSKGTFAYYTPSFTNSLGISSLALCPDGDTLLGAPDGFIATGASTGNLSAYQISGSPTAVQCSSKPTAMFSSGALSTVGLNGTTSSTGVNIPGSQILETAINENSTLALASGQDVNQVASGGYSLIGSVPSNVNPIGAASGDGFALLGNNNTVYYNGSSFSAGTGVLSVGFGLTPPPQGLTVKQMLGDAFNAALLCGGCFTQAIQGVSKLVSSAFSSQSAELEAEIGDAEMTDALPVNTANGNFSYQLPSISLVGRGPSVSFSPNYNSSEANVYGPVGLGPGFSDGALMMLSINNPSSGDITISQENGSQVTFYPQQSGGGCTAPQMAIDPNSSLDPSGVYFCAYPDVLSTLYSQTLSSPNSGTTATFIRFSPYEVSTFCMSSTCSDQGNSYSQGQLISLADKFSNTDVINQDSTSGTGCSATGYHCVAITDPSGRALTYLVCVTASCTSQNPSGEVVSVSDSIHTESFTYATATSTCATSTPASCVAGDLIGVSFYSTNDTTSRTWSFNYDETSLLNAIDSVVDPNGNTQLTNTYDDTSTTDTYFGWVTSQTNALNEKTSFNYHIDPSTLTGATVATDPLGNKTDYMYSGGLLQSVISGYGTSSPSQTSYFRGLNSLPEQTIDPNGNVYNFSYDTLGRLTSFQDPVKIATTFIYSNLTTLTPSYFDPIEIDLANPGSDSSGYSSILVSYDPTFGDLTKVEQNGNYGGGSTNPTPTSTYSWCASSTCTGGYLLGELESTTNPGGGVTTYSYDSSGDLISATNPDGDITSATYDSIGRILTFTTPDGNVPQCGCSANYTTTYASTTNPYTAFDQPTEIVGPPINGVSATTSYTYDADGNTLSTTSTTGTSTDAPGNTTTPTVVKSYAYNAANELCFSTTSTISSRNCSSPPNNPLTITYAYNLDGNLCYESVSAVSNPTCSTIPGGETTSWTYNSKGEVISQSEPFGTLTGSTNSGNTTDYAYDLAGNLLDASLSSGVSNIYSYNSANSLTGSTIGVPSTPGTTTYTESLNTISCGYATDCFTVGSTNTGLPVIIGGSPGNWTNETLPSSITSLSQISCSSSSNCEVVGESSGSAVVIYTSNSGSSWSMTTLSSTLATSLTSISCPSTTTCIATGEIGTTPVVIETTNGGLSFSNASGTPPTWEPSSIYCLSTTYCALVGTSSSTGVIDTWNGSTFSSSSISGSGSLPTSLNQISCGSTTECVAVGQSGTNASILTSTNPSTSFDDSTTAPSSLTSLSAIDCPGYPSATSCIATGKSGSNPSAVVIANNSGSFSTSLGTLPPGTSLVGGISCGSTTNCLIAGSTSANAGDILPTSNGGQSFSDQFNTTTNTYDGQGKIASTTDQLGQSTYAYDALGRLVAATDDLGHITTYAYDNNSNITCVGYQMATMSSGCSGTPSSTNPIVNYQYDIANRMTSLTTPMTPGVSSCGTTQIPNDTLSFTYDPNGSLISRQLPLCDNSSTNTLDTLTNTVDANYSLTGFAINYPSGPTTKSEIRNAASMLTTNWAGINTGYNSLGQLTYSSTTALGATTPPTYTYDNQGNPLVSPNDSYSQCFSTGGEILSQYSLLSPPTSCGSASPSPVNTFTYDSQGNRTSYMFPWNGQQVPAYYYYNSLGQMTGFSVFFTGWNYSYSGSGQLMQISSGSSNLATFTYNQLTSQILSDSTWDYVYGPGGTPVEAFKPNTALSQQYLITTDNNTVDAGLNTSNEVSFVKNYGSFGNSTPSSTQPQIGYDGAYNDPGTHFWIMGNRFYDPGVGLFINPDPSIALANQPYGYAGQLPSIGDPSQYYIFANNDPANNYDPTGTSCIFSLAGDLVKKAVDLGAQALAKVVEGIATDVGENLGEDVAAQVINTGSTTVYTSVNAATDVNYVGITNNFERRANEQLVERGINIKAMRGLENLSRSDARAVEQLLIERNGGPGGDQLLNKINSIAQSNPIYSQALQRGYDILSMVEGS